MNEQELRSSVATVKVELRSTLEIDQRSDFGIVAIGRNEGVRLQRCLHSLPPFAIIVYVDSGSIDRSVQWANQFGAHVVELDMSKPFTAARARNAGFKRLLEINPAAAFVQFIDGDCELIQKWPATALAFMRSNDAVAGAFGRVRERYPERSIYNRLCDWEWEGAPGETGAFGGIVLLRASALSAVHGYRDDIIAGEEPELAIRLRRAGWRIWRLSDDMTFHDADIHHFWQWWYRNMRSGYAFANGAYLHGASSDRHWVWESCRAWIWGIFLPLSCAVMSLALGWWGLATWLIYPFQALRLIFKANGNLRDRAIKSVFQLLGRFPEGLGQLKFLRDWILRRQSLLIEHK